MASETPTFNDKDVEWLWSIGVQVRDAKAPNGQASRIASRMASLSQAIETWLADEEYDGPDDNDDIYTVSSDLRSIARDLAPTAVTWWSADEVAARLTFVDAAISLHRVSPEDAAALESVRPYVLQAAGKRVRGSSEIIDGRPELVEIVDSDGERISRQAGNRPQSAQNLTSAILRTFDEEFSKEDRAEVRKAIQGVLDTGDAADLLIGGTSFTVRVCD